MKILPAIDILDGSCVRLLKGDFNHVTKYDSNPINQAKKFIENGFDYLHIIDLNAASTNSLDNLEIIQDIAKLSNLKIQVGGGIRSIERVKNLITLGVDRVIVGTAAMYPGAWCKPQSVHDRSARRSHQRQIPTPAIARSNWTASA